MVPVSPDLQVVTEARVVRVQILQQGVLLTLVAIPPLVGEFLVGVGVGVAGIAALTCTRGATHPDTFAVGGLT